MTGGSHARDRRHAFAVVASEGGALCRLPATGPWFWLVRSAARETSPAIGLVLLDGLPGILGALGAGDAGHG